MNLDDDRLRTTTSKTTTNDNKQTNTYYIATNRERGRDHQRTTTILTYLDTTAMTISTTKIKYIYLYIYYHKL